ncbi:MAG: PspA/IM30 family protein [Chloroflexi bacterium]|jgi:predicted  nucleic acid-binding Zn-ribbon protein|nr:MAG: PspA/IM30 family protein [Chloroflexi bacterium OLB13]MBC6955679.1 hypothetical protein [Chloroflexota bacterium]MBV6437015.1 hypothetical protein [Anaerolineae bacterium]MDL1917637.1 hypothetical protein [Anaerolineae bacterium CFX4]OQY86148.1 MAG: hypothetical protein B6D42_01860 [Anaerolineae bacterium UTCFX5]
MYDLLKKLNTLVSAQVNDLTTRLPHLERKPDLDRQVVELRERVAAALEHEDKLRAQVAQLQQEIAGLDARVDAAIQAGQEGAARALLEEIQRLQKRLAMAEADLRQHQNAAADLIVRVNALESAVGDLKASQPSAPPTQDTAPGSITQFMPPAEGEVRADTAKHTPQPAAQKPSAPAKPAPAAAPEAEERKPWDKPKTAKQAAEWAREDAEEQLERTTGGVEHVGGLLRDIQSRVTQRMNDLDRMLAEGGLIGEDAPPAPAGKPTPSSGKPTGKPSDKPDDDLSGRVSRLAKPD